MLSDKYIQYMACKCFIVHMNSVEKFLERAGEDLMAYAKHAGRHTATVEDAVLLLKRYGIYWLVTLLFRGSAVNFEMCHYYEG